MEFEKTFFDEEIRCGFPVSVKRKKIWAVELQMLELLDRICKKYNLKYYAGYGTLLGAVRHKGFIPWDDDVDIVMFREDYEKLKDVAGDEIRYPYFFQNTYTDNLISTFSKIRDCRTTALDASGIENINRGIFIDIFPLDDADDGNTLYKDVYVAQKEIWYAVTEPVEMLKLMDRTDGKGFVLQPDVLLNLIKMNVREGFKQFEMFNLSYTGISQNVDFITEAMTEPREIKREWFQQTELMSFENIMVPVPGNYDEVLTALYGDWHKYVMGGSAHEGIFIDPDKAYWEYL